MFSTPPVKKRTHTRAFSRSRTATPVHGDSPPETSRARSPNNSSLLSHTLSKRLGDGTPASLRRSTRRRGASSALGDDMLSLSGVVSNVSSLDGFRRDNDPSLLAKDDRIAAAFSGRLPDEVREKLVNADGYREPIFAYIDKTISYAVVALPNAAYVWSVKRRTASTTPNCLTFPLPSKSSDRSASPPLAIFTKPSNSREAGLLVVMARGLVMFWESINYGLSGVDQFKAEDIKLDADENIIDLKECEPAGYFLATNKHIYKLTLSNASGQSALTIHPVTKASGVMRRMTGLFGTAPTASGDGPIVSISSETTVHQDQSRALYVLTANSVSAWTTSQAYAEGLSVNKPVHELIARILTADISQDASSIPRQLDLRLLQIKSSGSRNSVYVLVSYSSAADAKRGPSDPQSRSYAIFTLDLEKDGNGIVRSYTALNYRDYEDPRAYLRPRLIIPAGPIAYVAFPQAVVIASIEPGLVFEDILSFKTSALNVVVGVSRESTQGNVELTKLLSGFSLLTKQHAITFQADVSAIRKEGQDLGSIDEEERAMFKQNYRIKSKLEQGVFFGSIPDNPLSLQWTEAIAGDFDAAALEVSNSILESRSPFLSTILDLRSNMHERLGKLNVLLKYIRSNGLLDKLSGTARRQLCENAEKVAAGLQLWQLQNSLQAQVSSAHDADESAMDTLKNQKLAKAILTFLEQRVEGFGEDGVRYFFAYNLSELGKLFELLPKELGAQGSTFHAVHLHSLDVYEINDAMLAITKSALRYRAENEILYGLEPTTGREPWTSTSSIIDVIRSEFEHTVQSVQSTSRHYDNDCLTNGAATQEDTDMADDVSAPHRNEGTELLLRHMKSQLPELADILLHLYFDKVRHAAGVSSQQDVHLGLVSDFQRLRPSVIKAVANIDRSRAFELADQYQDFRTLIELSHSPSVKTSNYIAHYMTKYKEEFGFQLYRWYVEHGKLRTLLEQDPIYNDMLSKFLASGSYSKIAWIHDLGTDKYAKASKTLTRTAAEEKNAQARKLFYSIGKLTKIADLAEDDLAKTDVELKITSFDDQIDVLNIQYDLQAGFDEVLEDNGASKKTVDQKTEVVVKRTAIGLEEFPHLRSHYSNIVRSTLGGVALSLEDLVDGLTLKDNVHEDGDDYCSAMEVYLRSSTVPDGRRQTMLSTIWRRIFNHDEWQVIVENAIAVTDQELAEHLRETAAYRALKLIVDRQEDIPLLSPQEALFAATEDELSARFPGLLQSDIQSLLEEYHSENDRLQHFIEDHRLLDFFSEIQRLAREDDGLQVIDASEESMTMDMGA